MVMSEFLRNRHEQLAEFSERGIDAETAEWRDAVILSTANTRLGRHATDAAVTSRRGGALGRADQERGCWMRTMLPAGSRTAQSKMP